MIAWAIKPAGGKLIRKLGGGLRLFRILRVLWLMVLCSGGEHGILFVTAGRIAQYLIDIRPFLWDDSGTVADAPGEKGLNAVASALQGLGIDGGQAAGEPVAGSPAGPPAKITPAERISGKSLTYDQIVDELLLSPPSETQGQLARRIGYSESWLSRLIASDAFQSKLASRVEKDIEPERREAFKLRFASIEEEARGILMASLQKLSERLVDPTGVPDQLIVKSIDSTSRLLGYGARTEPTTPRAGDMHLHLHMLADNLRKLNSSPDVSDAVIVPSAPAASAMNTVAKSPAVGGGHQAQLPGESK
jgi:hypothetical protein